MTKQAKRLFVLALSVPVIVAAGFVVDSTIGAPATPGAAYRAPNVAVVDVERVINDFLKMTGDMDRIRSKWASERRALEVLRDKIDSMQQEADIYPKESENYLKLRTQIAVNSAELKVKLEANEAGQNRDQGTAMLDAFRKSQEVINTYAKEKNLDLVMQVQKSEIKGASYEAISSQLIVRSVLFSSDALDVTDAIIERMR